MPDANNPNPPKPTPLTPTSTPASGSGATSGKPTKRSFQSPKGTRDLYPEDANLRRFITEAWRNASIRHGFEEIDGPTFEDADLYKVKSGDGILAEMFGVFSGKSPEDVDRVKATGEAPLVLRPEFTPTLARMYAARAAQLGKPTKWFTAGPFFRAERPQRGRLREFLQWNVDFIGLPAANEASREVPRLSEPDSSTRSTQPLAQDPLAESRARADAECIACCVSLLSSLGFRSDQVKVRVSDRVVLHALLDKMGVTGVESDRQRVMQYLDRLPKLSEVEALAQAGALAFDLPEYRALREFAEGSINSGLPFDQGTEGQGAARTSKFLFDYSALHRVVQNLNEMGVADWIVPDLSIVRGLAYYTGMVFEVIADGERAVAGGGRYDNLIELFGGPPTPAVGFGMGDVVLTNLLRDKGLLPEGKTLLDALSKVPASLRPDAFVVPTAHANNPDLEAKIDGLVRSLVAHLRRGSESCRPLHARHSYKSTRNVGKILKEAASQHARFAIIIESETEASIKPLDGGEQQPRCPIGEVPARLAAILQP